MQADLNFKNKNNKWAIFGFGKTTEDDPPRTVLGGHIDIVV